MREWVAERFEGVTGCSVTPDAVTIVNGSQQGLDLVAKIYLDPGDYVAIESPTYLAAIQAFDAYEPRYLTIDTDDDGMVPDSLERALASADPLPKFIYLIPNFQNPTGCTLKGERRERIVRVCERFDVPIIEDDPYGELRFEGEHLPALISLESKAPIIYLGTGSKIMAPGMRVAWLIIRDNDIREKIVLAKQGADLHSGTFAQYVFHEYVSNRDAFDAHVEIIARAYGSRRHAMSEALAGIDCPGLESSHPSGGMFIWVRLPGSDTAELLRHAAHRNVTFVPGVHFYPDRNVHDAMRLNFSNASEEMIRVGIERLGQAIASTALRDEVQ